MKFVLIVLCLIVILQCKLCSGDHSAFTDCSSIKCNSTDPNCDVIGQRCNDGFRMCCDYVCRSKRQPCRRNRPDQENPYRNHTDSIQHLNDTAFKARLEIIKEMHRKYAAERDCWPDDKCLNETTCKPNYHHCDNGQCVRLLYDCTPWWESKNYSASSKNVTCYPDNRCFRNQCLPHYWMCDNGECVHEQLVCRGGPNCDDGSDEAKCSGECYPPFRCSNNTCKYGLFGCDSGKCILQEQVCDTMKDCLDGSDEQNCSTKCYPQKACDSNGECKKGYFRCDKVKCIPDSNLCNQRQNCEDGLDEIRFGQGFKCILGSNFETCVLSQELLKNTEPKCADHSDICVKNGTNQCFTCLDQKLVIAGKQKCDGIFDCRDLSDECLCENSKAKEACKALCLEANSNSSSKHRKLPQSASEFISSSCNCKIGQLECGNGICVEKSQVCDGVRDCGDSDLDERCCMADARQNSSSILCPGDVYNRTQIKAAMCDGRPECHDLSDECNPTCESKPRFCNIKETLFNSKDGPFEFLCDKTSLYFDVHHICDGKWSACSPRIYEEEEGCPARFYCPNGDSISIDVNLLCDGIPQCDDHSDEIDCADRFYCENGVPYSVPISNKLDGKRDCSDFSDECPKDLDENVLSSRRELLGSPGFRVTTWIIGIVAVTGNIITFIGAAKSLHQSKNLNSISKINYVFLLNLSLADCLMGVYLISLSIKSIKLSGRYCMYDKAWRTGSTCAGLGGLALTSSQASVIILAGLTTLRLHSVLNPIKTKSFSIFVPASALLLSWTVSILVAVLPNAMQLSDYFVSEIWMPTNFTNMETRNKSSQIVLVQRLAAIQPVLAPVPKSTSWNALGDFIQSNYPELKIKGYFGYFSDNSVCLPKFFVSIGEAGWCYSVGIIMFNFSAFFYVCIAYWIIFRVSSNRHVKKTRSQQLIDMQKKVVRLVVTDFFCWIPICVMSFIHLGGIKVPDLAYAFSAVILLPINSAINPFLYSNTLAAPIERIYNRIFAEKKDSKMTQCAMKAKRAGSNINRSDDDDYPNPQSEETEEKTI